jgi:hypothetical protein
MVAHSIRKSFVTDQAAAVVEKLVVDLTSEGIELEAFRQGMEVELEHGSRDPRTNVTDDDPILTGKIALAHLRELPDYYDRLEEMERRTESPARDDDLESSHMWLRFEHQFSQSPVTVTDAE